MTHLQQKSSEDAEFFEPVFNLQRGAQVVDGVDDAEEQIGDGEIEHEPLP